MKTYSKEDFENIIKEISAENILPDKQIEDFKEITRYIYELGLNGGGSPFLIKAALIEYVNDACREYEHEDCVDVKS